MENLTEQQLQSIANYKRSGVFEIKILKNNLTKKAVAKSTAFVTKTIFLTRFVNQNNIFAI